MAHFTPFLRFIVLSLKLCLEKELKDEQINSGNLILILIEELTVVSHLRARIAEVAFSAFHSGL